MFYDLSHAVRADQLDISGLLNPCCILCSPHGVKLLTFPYRVKLTPFSTIDICIPTGSFFLTFIGLLLLYLILSFLAYIINTSNYEIAVTQFRDHVSPQFPGPRLL